MANTAPQKQNSATESNDPLWERALLVINELAPVTRRDDWWKTDAPRQIIAEAMQEAILERLESG